MKVRPGAGFPLLWQKLKGIYTNKLSKLAFIQIPNEDEVAKSYSCDLVIN